MAHPLRSFARGADVSGRRRAASGRGNSGSFAVEHLDEALDVDLSGGITAGVEAWAPEPDHLDAPATREEIAEVIWLARDAERADEQRAARALAEESARLVEHYLDRIDLGRYDDDPSMDVEDLQQEVAFEIWKTAAQSSETARHRERWASATARNALINVGARVRGEDRKAMRLLATAEDEFIVRHGRVPRAAEYDEMAERIRAEWPDPRHRPRVGFHEIEAVRVISYDADPGLVASRADSASTTTSPAAGSAADRAFNYLDEEGMGTRDLRAAAKSAWDAVAEAEGAPPVAYASLSARRMTLLRAAVDSSTDFIDLAERHLDGRLSEKEAATLFAPWGLAPEDRYGRERVAATLIKHSAYANDLWHASLRAASRRQAA